MHVVYYWIERGHISAQQRKPGVRYAITITDEAAPCTARMGRDFLSYTSSFPNSNCVRCSMNSASASPWVDRCRKRVAQVDPNRGGRDQATGAGPPAATASEVRGAAGSLRSPGTEPLTGFSPCAPD